jgi:hypothetical protein
MPFVAYASKDFDVDTVDNFDESILQVGLGWFPAGHNRVLKVSYAKVDPDLGPSRDQIVVQLQLFQF